MAAGVFTDLKGRIFGSLLVVKDSKKRHSSTGEVLWECLCICEKRVLRRTSKLTSGKVSTCGCRKINKKKLPGTKELRKRLKKRKTKLSLNDFTQEQRDQMVKEFLSGVTLRELETKYSIDYKSCYRYIQDYKDAINTAWELNVMVKTNKGDYSKIHLDKALAVRYIDPELKKIISEYDSNSLSKEELVYGWVFVKAGSNSVAMKESGFLEVLPKKNRTQVYQNLLGMYLREKPNVAKYIKELQLKNVQETEITKKYVQSELILQVEQLKEICASSTGAQARASMLKAIEMLGRSVGAFTDKVEVTKVDHGRAIDSLLIEAKKEVNETIEAGSYKVKDAK